MYCCGVVMVMVAVVTLRGATAAVIVVMLPWPHCGHTLSPSVQKRKLVEKRKKRRCIQADGKLAQGAQ